jgi:hypothetical protein
MRVDEKAQERMAPGWAPVEREKTPGREKPMRVTACGSV